MIAEYTADGVSPEEAENDEQYLQSVIEYMDDEQLEQFEAWEASEDYLKVAGEKFNGLKVSSKFARCFEIPYQSFRCWIEGKRNPPAYIIQLIGYALISGLPTEENTQDKT